VASRWRSSGNSPAAFGPREPVARARCAVAEAEIALVSLDLNWPKALGMAHDVLERHGDRATASHARYLKTRRLLIGCSVSMTIVVNRPIFP
jgi:hypothetical protein